MYRKLINSKQRAGITISEVLIASLLLITATVPILKALTGAQAASVRIDRKSQSLMLARAKIEEIRVRTIYDYGNSYSADSTTLGGSYLCNISDSAVSSNLRQIVVSAGFDENANGTLGGDEISVTLQTLIARRW
jgi:Tfp pilus assembly protein PilV